MGKRYNTSPTAGDTRMCIFLRVMCIPKVPSVSLRAMCIPKMLGAEM